jgi:hypothetical protein
MNRHWSAPERAQNLARLRQLASRIHALGPRPFYEMLCELDAGADLHHTLERYAKLPADFIAAFGGDKMPLPVRAIAGGRS